MSNSGANSCWACNRLVVDGTIKQRQLACDFMFLCADCYDLPWHQLAPLFKLSNIEDSLEEVRKEIEDQNG
jgi:hypothetical protein